MSADAGSAAPRIPPVTVPDDVQREVKTKAPVGPDGSVRNIFSTLAHHPVLLRRFNAFAGTFMRFSAISPYERELVILRVAGRIGSRYEYAQHVPIARDAGLDDDRIRAVMLQPGAPALPDADRLLLAMTDELLATGSVTDATWDALARDRAPDALLELLFIAGFYR